MNRSLNMLLLILLCWQQLCSFADIQTGGQEMEPYLSDTGSVLYDGLWNDCVAGFYCRGAEYL